MQECNEKNTKYVYDHIPIFVCGQVPRIACIRSVMNTCISAVYFLYIYTACDVFYSALISYVANSSQSFSLWALHSAYGFITPWQPRYYHIYMCTHVVLTSRAGTLVQPRSFCPLLGWLPNRFQALYPYEFRGSHQEYAQTPGLLQPSGFHLAHSRARYPIYFRSCTLMSFLVATGNAHRPSGSILLCLVSVLRTQRFVTRFAQVKLCWILDSYFKLSHPCSSVNRFSD